MNTRIIPLSPCKLTPDSPTSPHLNLKHNMHIWGELHRSPFPHPSLSSWQVAPLYCSALHNLVKWNKGTDIFQSLLQDCSQGLISCLYGLSSWLSISLSLLSHSLLDNLRCHHSYSIYSKNQTGESWRRLPYLWSQAMWPCSRELNNVSMSCCADNSAQARVRPRKNTIEDDWDWDWD